MPEQVAPGGSDAELITRVRAGDRAAFGVLYARHSVPALTLARQFSKSQAEADDLVSESFARVLDTLISGGGPDTAFRAYLFTTLRNTAYDRSRKDKRLQFTDDVEAHDAPVDVGDPVIIQAENTLVGKAFGALPERWQAVLWYTQVDGLSPAETGVLLGMTANAVTSLAYRAREGLREAYLQAHLADTAAEACRTTVDRLGAWARGGLSKREQAQVDAHLQDCDRCRALAAELTEINSGMRVILAPLLLGGAAAAYLATTGPALAIAPVGTLAAAGAATGAATGGTAAGTISGATAGGGAHAAAVGSFWTRPWVLACGGAAAAAAVVAVTVIIFAGNSSPNQSGQGPLVTPAASATSTGRGQAGGTGGGSGPGSGSGDGSGSGSGNGSGTGPATPSGTSGGSVPPGTATGSGSSGNGTGGTGTGTGGTGGAGGSGATSGAPGGQSGSGGTLPGGAGGGGSPGAGNGQTTPGQGGHTSNASTPGGSTTPTTTGATPPGSTATAPTTAPSTAPATTTAQTTAPATTTRPSTSTVPTTATTSHTTPSTQTTKTTATTPTTPTTPTTTTTSTTPPNPILSASLGAVVAPAAGGNGSVSFTVANSGTGASAASTIRLADTLGASIVGGTATQTPSGSGLRRFATVLSTELLSCNAGGTTCTLGPIGPATTVAVTLTIHVPTTAATGPLVIEIGDLVISTAPLSFAAGLSALTLGVGQTLTAGTSTTAELLGTLGEGVSDPISITLPLRAGDLLITGVPKNCQSTGGNTAVTCAPLAGTAPDYGAFGITLTSSASGQQNLIAVLPGKQQVPVHGPTGKPLEVIPIDPGSPVALTGSFGGVQVGATSMECSLPNLTREQCAVARRMAMVTRPQTLTVPAGATVVAATLTWAAANPANGKPDSLDTVTLHQGGRTTTVNGTSPPGVRDIKHTLYIRTADVTDLLVGTGSVWVGGIAARTTPGPSQPMAGWALDVIWYDPSASTGSVQFGDPSRLSESSGNGNSTAIAPAGDAISALSVTLWAPDPWARKAIMVGGQPVGTAPIEGVVTDASGRLHTTGVDLLTGIVADSRQGVTIRNTKGPATTGFRTPSVLDALWIGPTLVIRSSQQEPPPA
jgi:RNA polymerase sigma factor (sigma-70 family)